MKKFISLVLTLALALSLVTVSAGATDFEDDGDITYQEAIDVIAGLGIVDGYTDGSFRPDEVLTRGAAAKIICNLILGPTTASVLSATSAPFVDVPVTNTFAGYITYCSQQGIINGYSDGTFRPTATLTGNAFMKMLLGALGYDASIEGYTGANWNVSVLKQAVGIGLDDGNDNFLGSQAVTREEACLYAFNMLQATMVEYSNSNTIVVGDVTVSTSSTRSDVENTTKTDGNIDDDGLMQFAEKYFDDLVAEDDVDSFGRPATTWDYDGDELGTYANDADAVYVVEAANKSLSTLLTDSDYMGYSSKDILNDAVVYYNGMGVDSDDSAYQDNADAADLAGKGDIIEVFENDDSDVDTIVIRSYTYARIDTADDDVSSSQSNKGATVALDLVDINGDSLGNGTYFDDYDDDEYVLNGYNSDYTEGTVIAVAFGEDDAILDSYVMETVTGTPSSATAVATYAYTDAASGNAYYNSGNGVKSGAITIDGTKYTYAAQFTGLPAGSDVDFDEEYTVYLTAEGYALAVDGDAAISLKDVYFVVGLYSETSRGSESFYAQAISVTDGVEHTLRLDYEDISGGDDAETQIQNAFGLKSKPDLSTYVTVYGLFELDEDSSKYTVSGDGAWTGNDTYSVASTDDLYDDVTSGDSVIRLSSTSRAYIQDNTFFIGAEGTGDDLDISTATGMMSVKKSTGLNVFVIKDGSDAVFVIYAAGQLIGAANKDDVVYMADDADTRNSSETLLADLYFLSDMSLEEDAVIDDDQDTQGFYVYSLSDDVYDLDRDATALTATNTEDGYAEYVVFNEGRNNTVTSVTSGDDFDAAAAIVGSSKVFDDVAFDAYSVADATVIDTRSSGDRSDDLYSNTITSASRLISALDRGWVVADIYMDDGEIIFVAVRECEDSESTAANATITASDVSAVAGKTATGTFSISSGKITSVVSNNTSVATVSGTTGSSTFNYTVSGVAAGSTTITITGTGSNGSTVTKSVTVTVTSGAEAIVLSSSAVTVSEGTTGTTANTAQVSAVLDGGYITSVTSAADGTATAAVTTGTLNSSLVVVTVTGVAAGTTTVTIQGVTSSGDFVSKTVAVTVLDNDTTLATTPGKAVVTTSNETAYTASVSLSDSTVNVELSKDASPVAGDKIVVTLTPNDTAATASGSVTLTYGDSSWTSDETSGGKITVTAEDGTTKDYTVNTSVSTAS